MKGKLLFVSFSVLSCLLIVSLTAIAQDNPKDKDPVIEFVNINTATLEELQALPGIGPKLAQAIIDSRPYESVEELIEVKGIGEKKLVIIKELIAVGDVKTAGPSENTAGPSENTAEPSENTAEPQEAQKLLDRAAEQGQTPVQKVDLNSATKEELDALPGISEKMAQAIVDGQPYEKVEDLLDIKGIGQKTLEKIQALLEVKPVEKQE